MPHDLDVDVDEFQGFATTHNFLQDKYRGLRQEESDVLRAYLRDVGTDSLQRLRTAWPVGEGERPARLDPAFQQLAQNLSRWKIDAVLDWPNQTEIVELKSRATHTAVGQVVFYSLALGEVPDERSDFKLSVVAFRSHPDLEQRVRRVGVGLHTVPHADRSGATARALADRLDESR
jgi:hypothetical protein